MEKFVNRSQSDTTRIEHRDEEYPATGFTIGYLLRRRGVGEKTYVNSRDTLLNKLGIPTDGLAPSGGFSQDSKGNSTLNKTDNSVTNSGSSEDGTSVTLDDGTVVDASEVATVIKKAALGIELTEKEIAIIDQFNTDNLDIIEKYNENLIAAGSKDQIRMTPTGFAVPEFFHKVQGYYGNLGTDEIYLETSNSKDMVEAFKEEATKPFLSSVEIDVRPGALGIAISALNITRKDNHINESITEWPIIYDLTDFSPATEVFVVLSDKPIHMFRVFDIGGLLIRENVVLMSGGNKPYFAAMAYIDGISHSFGQYYNVVQHKGKRKYKLFGPRKKWEEHKPRIEVGLTNAVTSHFIVVPSLGATRVSIYKVSKESLVNFGAEKYKIDDTIRDPDEAQDSIATDESVVAIKED